MLERINALARAVSASKYLEIGVAQGVTFGAVDVPYKVGVDPKFEFDAKARAGPNTIFHEVTSDRFFAKLAAAHGAFDLIYLDGLHTFEQTFRDFCASLSVAHARTVWLLDDTHPTSPLAASPSLRATKRIRRFVRSGDRRWMGDVFKVVFAIHDFFPQFSYATFSGHGQTAVWFSPREDFAPTWNSLGKIARLGYLEFLRFRSSHLSIMDEAQIVERVARRSGR
jgi:hypothetical protein